MAVHGFLPVDKPSGCTSHDVVAQIRRHFKLKKVGHTGTLDPMATGVLVLAMGAFTRLSGFLTDRDKRYRAAVRLGVETDTQDAEGKVVRKCDDVPPDTDRISDLLPEFLGDIEQVPPMFSALKQDGKRLYELARKGRTVVREPRRVRIFELRVLGYCPPLLSLEIHCSKGTYIRTLAADLGHRLGCGAHLAALRRLSVGGIVLDDCALPDRLLALGDASELSSHLLDPARALVGMPAFALDATQSVRFLHGNAVTGLHPENPATEHIRVYDDQDVFLGIGSWHAGGALQPVRVISRPEV